MSRSKFLVRMLLAGVATLTGFVLIITGLDPVSVGQIVVGMLFLTGGLVFNIESTHQRLKDIFTGQDMWVVWGGYIVLSLIPVVSLVTLAVFFLPSGKFAKKN